LSQKGFRVSTASNAAEARQHLSALDFDLIVLDVMMPGETGLDFAAGLRRTDDVPILMLTAMGETKDRIAGLETGVDDYLGKPFEPRELLLRIQNVLRRGRPGAAPSGEALSRETLCKSVGSAVNERAIDVQVTRLRRKIEPDPSFPRYLRTVRGQGYRLVDA